MTSDRLHSIQTEESEAKGDVPASEPGDDSTNTEPGVLALAEDYLRKHPVAWVAIVFGIGALLQAALTAAAQRPAEGTETRKRKVPQRDRSRVPESPSNLGRTHHFGAADMEFTTHHSDGKDVVFKFAWKKRPTDAPENDWPTDKMGFTAVRPNGKRTAFTFEGKTRPIPDEKSAVGDSRPGLGWARMEFKSSAPGRGDFKFTWSRTPPDAESDGCEQTARISRNRKGPSTAVSAAKKQGKRPDKKTAKKKATKKKATKKKATKKKTTKKKTSNKPAPR